MHVAGGAKLVMPLHFKHLKWRDNGPFFPPANE